MANKWNPGCCACGDTEVCYCTAVPLTVTLSGATGCLSFLNGTFAMAKLAPCSWGIAPPYDPPVNPCVDGCSSGSTAWFWLTTWRVQVTLAVGLSHYKIDAGTTWSKYSLSGGICSGPAGTPSSLLECRRVDCSSGVATIASSSVFDPLLGTNPTSCSIAF